jgi:hypothetical protein
MAGRKAELTTDVIRELILSFQARGPRGLERSYYRLVLITWGAEAELYPGCDMAPVRQVDIADVFVRGEAGTSNMAKALEFAYAGLSKYLAEVVEPHPERSAHPLPVVIIFSDGLDETSDPAPIARQIRELSVDEIAVPLVTVGVSAEDSEPANEELLRSLVCSEYYLRISELGRLFDLGNGPLAPQRETAKEPDTGESYRRAREHNYEVIRQVLRRFKHPECE